MTCWRLYRIHNYSTSLSRVDINALSTLYVGSVLIPFAPSQPQRSPILLLELVGCPPPACPTATSERHSCWCKSQLVPAILRLICVHAAMKRDDWWRNANSPAVCPGPSSGRCTPAEQGPPAPPGPALLPASAAPAIVGLRWPWPVGIVKTPFSSSSFSKSSYIYRLQCLITKAKHRVVHSRAGEYFKRLRTSVIRTDEGEPPTTELDSQVVQLISKLVVVMQQCTINQTSTTGSAHGDHMQVVAHCCVQQRRTSCFPLGGRE